MGRKGEILENLLECWAVGKLAAIPQTKATVGTFKMRNTL